MESLTESEARDFPWLWDEWWARPSQLPPDGDWRVWLLLAGRGFGKSRVGAEQVRKFVAGGRRRIALVAPTAADVRDVMVEGESGILSVGPPGDRPHYEPSKRRLTWPNGAIATTFSADEPERLRGPQHDAAWCFTAGTQIRCVRGLKAIEQVATSDFVLTRIGYRRAVANSVRRNIAVGTVVFSNGTELTGTAEHPILSFDGWVKLSELKVDQLVCAVNVSSGAEGAGTATKPVMGISNTGELEAWVTPTGTDYIGLCGDRLTAKFLRAMIFIIATKTLRTTGSAIWSACRTASINLYIFSKLQFLKWIGKRSLYSANHVPIVVRRSCGSSMPAKLSAGDVNSAAPTIGVEACERVGIVAGSLKASPAGFAVRVVSTWEPVGRDTVYNLQVEGPAEYIANGIVVHNCDEIASWRYPDAWDMLMFGLRLGNDPRVIVTTTPKPVRIIRELLIDPTAAITRGSSYENRANLAPAFFAQIVKKYEGTRLGRQELNAEVLDDVPGALWNRQCLDDARWPSHRNVPELRRVVVAIDPAATSGEEADETGIIVAGKDDNGRGFVLEDKSGRYPPTEWARLAISLYQKFGADRIVAEVNNGGDMVEATIRMIDANVSYSSVRATRGKVVRAEPVAALYEQGKVHHVGALATLEDQMCAFTTDFDRKVAGYSPDRVDALVWALTELLVEPMPSWGIFEYTRQRAAELTKDDKQPVFEKPQPTWAVGSAEWLVSLQPKKPTQ